jgi:hypothetical protein
MDFFGAQDTILWYKNAFEVVFDKTAFVNYLRLVGTHNFKQNNDPNQPIGFKNLKKKSSEPKVSTLLPNVCDFQ